MKCTSNKIIINTVQDNRISSNPHENQWTNYHSSGKERSKEKQRQALTRVRSWLSWGSQILHIANHHFRNSKGHVLFSLKKRKQCLKDSESETWQNRKLTCFLSLLFLKTVESMVFSLLGDCSTSEWNKPNSSTCPRLMEPLLLPPENKSEFNAEVRIDHKIRLILSSIAIFGVVLSMRLLKHLHQRFKTATHESNFFLQWQGHFQSAFFVCYWKRSIVSQ